MAEENLDALIATDITNYIYLGGHKILRIVAGSRPQLVILPRDGEPVLIAQSLFEQLVEKTSWIKNLKLWEELPFTIKPIREALEELKVTKGRVGVDLGGEYRLGIAYEDFMELKKELPKAKFTDATKVFLKLRLIKSAGELGRIRKACDITSKAYEKLFDTLKPRMSEKEIANMMANYLTEEGGGVGFVTVHIMPGAILTNSPTDRTLKKGDTLFLDSGATVDGYTCDFSRLGVVGEPSDRLKEMYELCTNITWKEINAIKPGVKASDVAKVGAMERKKAGLRGRPAGRDGHGLGLGGLELPSIGLNDDTVLEPAMVITIEPEVSTVTLKKEVSARLPQFDFVQEENLLVTKSGYEVLSSASRGLHVV